MRKLCGLIVLVISLLGASSASAATEVGNSCSGDSPVPATVLQLARTSADPLPLTAPAAGIVTQWKVNSKFPIETSQQLKVFEATGDPKVFKTVADGSTGSVHMGSNTFEARIPVKAGDRFGAFGGPGGGGLICLSPEATDEVGIFPTNATVGSANKFEPITGYKVALSVVIEADADGDGYGDETQDKCPRSAAIQAIACPLISLGSFGLVNKSSALIVASASSQTQVTVLGTVKTPKGGKKGKKAKASALISIPAGTKPIAPGQVVPFTLSFPQSLKSALAAMSPKQSLTLSVSTTATDLAGQPSSSVLDLKLKGTKKKAK